MLVGLARAFAEGREQDAERLQDEVTRLERDVTAGPPLVGLKRAVAGALAERGVGYPAAPRSPLGI